MHQLVFEKEHRDDVTNERKFKIDFYVLLIYVFLTEKDAM